MSLTTVRRGRVTERVVHISAPPDGPGPWIIGRSPDHARMVIDADTVSRAHASLRPAADGWEVRDLNSTNGTWINGWRVDRAVVGPGDQLVLGDVRVVLR